MLELERLDLLWRAALRLVQTDSFQVHQGRIVDGVVDEGIKLAALDRLVRISERRSRLLGLDASSRHSVEILDEQTVGITALAVAMTTTYSTIAAMVAHRSNCRQVI